MANLLSTIGAALFGEKGLAGGVVSTLQDVGLLKDPKEAQAAIERMKALELRGEELNLETLKVTTGDQANAREMQKAALGQEDKLAKRFIYWYAILGSTFTFLYATAITFITLPAANKELAYIIIGFLLGSVVGTFITFFYGTSYGSLKKNKQLENLSAKLGKGGREDM